MADFGTYGALKGLAFQNNWGQSMDRLIRNEQLVQSKKEQQKKQISQLASYSAQRTSAKTEFASKQLQDYYGKLEDQIADILINTRGNYEYDPQAMAQLNEIRSKFIDNDIIRNENTSMQGKAMLDASIEKIDNAQYMKQLKHWNDYAENGSYVDDEGIKRTVYQFTPQILPIADLLANVWKGSLNPDIDLTGKTSLSNTDYDLLANAIIGTDFEDEIKRYYNIDKKSSGYTGTFKQWLRIRADLMISTSKREIGKDSSGNIITPETFKYTNFHKDINLKENVDGNHKLRPLLTGSKSNHIVQQQIGFAFTGDQDNPNIEYEPEFEVLNKRIIDKKGNLSKFEWEKDGKFNIPEQQLPLDFNEITGTVFTTNKLFDNEDQGVRAISAKMSMKKSDIVKYFEKIGAPANWANAYVDKHFRQITDDDLGYTASINSYDIKTGDSEKNYLSYPNLKKAEDYIVVSNQEFQFMDKQNGGFNDYWMEYEAMGVSGYDSINHLEAFQKADRQGLLMYGGISGIPNYVVHGWNNLGGNEAKFEIEVNDKPVTIGPEQLVHVYADLNKKQKLEFKKHFNIAGMTPFFTQWDNDEKTKQSINNLSDIDN